MHGQKNELLTKKILDYVFASTIMTVIGLAFSLMLTVLGANKVWIIPGRFSDNAFISSILLIVLFSISQVRSTKTEGSAKYYAAFATHRISNDVNEKTKLQNGFKYLCSGFVMLLVSFIVM